VSTDALAQSVYENVMEAAREMRYQQRIEAERKKGQDAVRKMTREWRRELWPSYPDPIDRENALRLVASLKKMGEAATSARIAFERARMAIFNTAVAPLPPMIVNDDGTWERDLTDWRVGARIAMSISPVRLDAMALVTSPT